MSGNNRDRAWPPGQGGSAAEQADAWHVDRRRLWGWIGDLLDATPDTHAPAVLVHAQAAGVLLEHLVAAAIVQSYVDRHGRPDEPDAYEADRVRAVVHDLKQT